MNSDPSTHTEARVHIHNLSSSWGGREDKKKKVDRTQEDPGNYEGMRVHTHCMCVDAGVCVLCGVCVCVYGLSLVSSKRSGRVGETSVICKEGRKQSQRRGGSLPGEASLSN